RGTSLPDTGGRDSLAGGPGEPQLGGGSGRRSGRDAVSRERRPARPSRTRPTRQASRSRQSADHRRDLGSRAAERGDPPARRRRRGGAAPLREGGRGTGSSAAALGGHGGRSERGSSRSRLRPRPPRGGLGGG